MSVTLAYNVDIFLIKKLYSIVKDKPIKLAKIKTKNAKSGVRLIDALIYLKNSFIRLSTTLLDYCLSIISASLSSESRYNIYRLFNDDPILFYTRNYLLYSWVLVH
ncbi:MAG: hypothetical protein DBO98_05620 [Candidatus Liberibacter europaeus]|nr:hypothetical protein [Candidatus Liberibacter europaeus]